MSLHNLSVPWYLFFFFNLGFSLQLVCSTSQIFHLLFMRAFKNLFKTHLFFLRLPPQPTLLSPDTTQASCIALWWAMPSCPLVWCLFAWHPPEGFATAAAQQQQLDLICLREGVRREWKALCSELQDGYAGADIRIRPVPPCPIVTGVG